MTDLAGKICLITGATSGVGLHSAIGLAALGADVVLVGRSAERTEAAASLVRAAAGRGPREIFLADLSSIAEVRRLAQEVQDRLPRLDVLLNNAGAFFLTRHETADGLERTFALNHLGYFLLTRLLFDRLRSAAPSRVVNVASNAHWSARLRFDDLQLRSGFLPWLAYSNSKLCNVWFTYELARRWAPHGITANTLTPGFVATNFAQQNLWIRPFLSVAFFLLAKPSREGARTPVYVAASPELTAVTGKFFQDERPARSSPRSYVEADAARLWDVSEELTGIR